MGLHYIFDWHGTVFNKDTLCNNALVEVRGGSAMSPSPKHFCGAHQIRRSVLVMAAPVMVLELMLRQAAAAIDKAGGYRACAYSPLAQPSLVGSTCTVGEPAPPATP